MKSKCTFKTNWNNVNPYGRPCWVIKKQFANEKRAESSIWVSKEIWVCVTIETFRQMCTTWPLSWKDFSKPIATRLCFYFTTWRVGELRINNGPPKIPSQSYPLRRTCNLQFTCWQFTMLSNEMQERWDKGRRALKKKRRKETTNTHLTLWLALLSARAAFQLK